MVDMRVASYAKKLALRRAVKNKGKQVKKARPKYSYHKSKIDTKKKLSAAERNIKLWKVKAAKGEVIPLSIQKTLGIKSKIQVSKLQPSMSRSSTAIPKIIPDKFAGRRESVEKEYKQKLESIKRQKTKIYNEAKIQNLDLKNIKNKMRQAAKEKRLVKYVKKIGPKPMIYLSKIAKLESKERRILKPITPLQQERQIKQLKKYNDIFKKYSSINKPSSENIIKKKLNFVPKKKIKSIKTKNEKILNFEKRVKELI